MKTAEELKTIFQNNRVDILLSIDERRKEIVANIFKEDSKLNSEGFIELRKNYLIGERHDDDTLNEYIEEIHSINNEVNITSPIANPRVEEFDWISTETLISILEELEYFVQHPNEVQIN